MLRRTVLALALVVLVSLPVKSQAQGVVPGGWAPQFGYGVVVGPGAVGYGAGASFGVSAPGYGYGYPGFAGMNPYGMGYGYPGFGGGMGFNSGQNGMGYAAPVDQTANGLNPLINSVRHATRKRRAH